MVLACAVGQLQCNFGRLGVDYYRLYRIAPFKIGSNGKYLSVEVEFKLRTMSRLVNGDAKARNREKGARACWPQPLLLLFLQEQIKDIIMSRVLYLLRRSC